MLSYADPPLILRDVFPNIQQIQDLLATHAPYTPLGGWYNPGADPHAKTRPMWFQNDWVHDTYIAEGSEIFLNNDTYIEQSKAFYNADIIEPHSVYVNIMAAINDGGPAHTDNSRFHGRERANTPMWLLRAMTWSHLFNAYEIVQATAIWWLDDVEGGGLLYWPDGPDHPPTEHVGDMKNTALLGDNHGMFHQVGPVGPFDNGTVLVTPSAQLLPTEDNTWVVTDHEEKIYEAPLNAYRISVLWKANVYTNIDEQKHKQANPLSIEDVITIFNADLEDHGHGLRLSKENIEDESTITAMAKIYPEPKPVNALPSVFETIRK